MISDFITAGLTQWFCNVRVALSTKRAARSSRFSWLQCLTWSTRSTRSASFSDWFFWLVWLEWTNVSCWNLRWQSRNFRENIKIQDHEAFEKSRGLLPQTRWPWCQSPKVKSTSAVLEETRFLRQRPIYCAELQPRVACNYQNVIARTRKSTSMSNETRVRCLIPTNLQIFKNAS